MFITSATKSKNPKKKRAEGEKECWLHCDTANVSFTACIQQPRKEKKRTVVPVAIRVPFYQDGMQYSGRGAFHLSLSRYLLGWTFLHNQIEYMYYPSNSNSNHN